MAMSSDKSAEVRRAAVLAVDLSKRTLSAVVKRTRDVDANVRAAALDALRKKVGIKQLTAEKRAAVLRHGLVQCRFE